MLLAPFDVAGIVTSIAVWQYFLQYHWTTPYRPLTLPAHWDCPFNASELL